MGITEAELLALAKQLIAEGQKVEVDPEELKAYFPQEEDSFYLPRCPKNWYYDPEAFKNLHSIDYDGLRKLITPNLRRLRR
jgi:hypothetical protein